MPRPTLRVTVTSDAMTVADRAISGLELTATGRLDPANPAANIAVKGTVAGEALSGSAVLSTVDGRREVKGLSLLLGKNRIAGDLTLDEAFVPKGTVTSTCPTSVRWLRWRWKRPKGDLAGTIDFRMMAQRRARPLSARAQSLVRGDLARESGHHRGRRLRLHRQPGRVGRRQAAEVTSGATVVKAST